MAYDPQANRRRSRPETTGPAPVDALLGSVEDASAVPVTEEPTRSRTPDDPPPAPGVTPEPADPVPDVVLAGTGMAGIGAGVALVLLLRWIWKRNRSADVADT